MKKNTTIPKDYMTVGEVAKKMGVTVRALQYYDRENLLSPSSESEGGRRLYTHKDVIKLHQILSMKHLGFSLDEIKNRLTSLDSPADVACALTEQATIIQEKISSLSEALDEIEALKVEVLQMQQVDFKKYADIIVNLQMKNEFYWLIKYFDDKTLDYIRNRFDKDSGLDMIETFKRLQDKTVQLQSDGVAPDSESGQALAKEFWGMVMEFSGGDMSLLPTLMEFGNPAVTTNGWQEKQLLANTFLEPALDAYFTSIGYNPFENTAK